MYNGAFRDDHDTIDNSNLQNFFAFQFKFLTLNKNIYYNKEMLEKFGLNEFLELPLTNKDIPVSDAFKFAVDDVMKIEPNFYHKPPISKEM